jgi:hypothetical protein
LEEVIPAKSPTKITVDKKLNNKKITKIFCLENGKININATNSMPNKFLE